jgi:hypothetical protein
MMEGRAAGTVTVRGLDHIQRTRSRAHRRMMATVRSLAAVRRCEQRARSTRAGGRQVTVDKPVA